MLDCICMVLVISDATLKIKDNFGFTVSHTSVNTVEQSSPPACLFGLTFALLLDGMLKSHHLYADDTDQLVTALIMTIFSRFGLFPHNLFGSRMRSFIANKY